MHIVPRVRSIDQATRTDSPYFNAPMTLRENQNDGSYATHLRHVRPYSRLLIFLHNLIYQYVDIWHNFCQD
jgi:hypothetical protein